MAVGLLNPDKEKYNDGKDPFIFRVEIPQMLSLLAKRELNAFVPGVKDIIEGGYVQKDGTVALSRENRAGEEGHCRIGFLSFGKERRKHCNGRLSLCYVAREHGLLWVRIY